MRDLLVADRLWGWSLLERGDDVRLEFRKLQMMGKKGCLYIFLTSGIRGLKTRGNRGTENPRL
jgi:hypothetical protein